MIHGIQKIIVLCKMYLFFKFFSKLCFYCETLISLSFYLSFDFFFFNPRWHYLPCNMSAHQYKDAMKSLKHT